MNTQLNMVLDWEKQNWSSLHPRIQWKIFLFAQSRSKSVALKNLWIHNGLDAPGRVCTGWRGYERGSECSSCHKERWQWGNRDTGEGMHCIEGYCSLPQVSTLDLLRLILLLQKTEICLDFSTSLVYKSYRQNTKYMQQTFPMVLGKVHSQLRFVKDRLE